MSLNEWLVKAADYLYYGTLGAFAALVGLLYQAAKRDGSLSFLILCATVVFGFYLGMLFGSLLPADWGNRDAVVLLVGASGMKGFEIVLRISKTVIAETLGVRGKSSGSDPEA